MMTDRAITAYGGFILRYRWLALTVSLLLALLAAAGTRHSEFTASYRVWFGPDNPELTAFTQFENTFSSVDGLTFVVQPLTGEIFAPIPLAALGVLTERAWQIPYAISVQSLTNVPYSYVDGDTLTVENFFPDPSSVTPAEIQKKRALALTDPIIVRQLVSQDARAAAVQVVLQLPRGQSQAPLEVMRAAETIAEELRAVSGLRIAITGSAAIEQGFFDSKRWDTYVLGPIIYGIFLAVIWIITRSLSVTAGVMVVALLSPAIAMGLFDWLGVKLNALSAVNFLITVTLALADSIHLTLSMLHEMRAGKSKREALLEGMRLNLRPIFFTTATTVISFLSLNFADSPPFHDFGNMVAIGATAAFLLSVTLLPALLMLLPVRVSPEQRFAFEAFMHHLAEFSIRRQIPLLAGFFAAIAVSAVFIPRIALNDNTSEYFSPRMTLRQDIDFTKQAMGIAHVIEIPVVAMAPGGKIYDPRFLEKLDDFSTWLRAQPEVTHIAVISDLFKRLNRDMHGGHPAWYRLPATSEEAAQYLLLYELGLPQGMDLNRQIDVDRRATRVTVSLHSMDSAQIKAVKLRAEEWLRQQGAGVLDTSGITGLDVMFTYIAERNIDNMLFGNFFVVITILALLMLSLRSIRYGIVSLIPNLLPVVLALGFWALVIREIGMAISVAVSACIGIIVDDNMHFIDKFLRARREKHLSAEDAIRYAFGGVGREILCTSCIIIAGFSVLVFSPFQVNLQMNLLFLLIIGLGLVADFLFMSPLLLTLSRWKILT